MQLLELPNDGESGRNCLTSNHKGKVSLLDVLCSRCVLHPYTSGEERQHKRVISLQEIWSQFNGDDKFGEMTGLETLPVPSFSPCLNSEKKCDKPSIHPGVLNFPTPISGQNMVLLCCLLNVFLLWSVLCEIKPTCPT